MEINVFFGNNPVTRTDSHTKSIDYAVPEQLCDIHPVTPVVMKQDIAVKADTSCKVCLLN